MELLSALERHLCHLGIALGLSRQAGSPLSLSRRSFVNREAQDLGRAAKPGRLELQAARAAAARPMRPPASKAELRLALSERLPPRPPAGGCFYPLAFSSLSEGECSLICASALGSLLREAPFAYLRCTPALTTASCLTRGEQQRRFGGVQRLAGARRLATARSF